MTKISPRDDKDLPPSCSWCMQTNDYIHAQKKKMCVTYQVIKKALKDDKDPTKFFLVYANQTPSDILLREDLDG